METKGLEKSIKDVFENGKYVIPLYQRNYAWRKNEIEQLLQDVYESFCKNPNGNYFIGSLVVLKRQNGDFEVIDGQQRLTTLSLITKLLGINKSSCLFYDSRPEVEEFFKVFYNNGDVKRIDYPQTIHLKNAIDYINEANLDANNVSPTTIDLLKEKKESFVKYFSNNVMLIRVEIPEDTDVATYFEIMNNRGVQLQKHEILKSFLLSKLEKSEQKEYAQIWDACSQMDIPIQRSFDAGLRVEYFGKDYTDFINPVKKEDAPTKQRIAENKSYSINEILQGETNKELSDSKIDEDSEVEEEASEYKSIIDFPNFLMHILKIKYNDEYISIQEDTNSKDKGIPLNEKYLLMVYDKIEKSICSKDFITTLFFCRTVFDRNIVKTITDKNVEDEIKWTLHKPTKYDKSWKYTNTFGDSDEQARIIKALSMLQVTFRTRIYKNWLQDILNWFYKEKKNINVEANEYIEKLDALILQYYDERKIEKKLLTANECVTKENSYSLGTGTPHFIFNFIDYLYWVENKNTNKHNIEYSADIKDFDFKYWNSVEHHMAREWADRNSITDKDEFIDNLGNLCLISKSSNSRLSDRDVKEKVQTFGGGNLGAKRQIMYEMSKDEEDKYTWTKDKIKQHYNDLLELLKNRKDILGNKYSTLEVNN